MKRSLWFGLVLFAVALISYGAVCDASAQDTTTMGRGLAELSAGRYAQAVEVFQQAIKQNPQDAQSHYCLGVSFQYMGRLQEANAQYAWVLKNSKDAALLQRAQRGATATIPVAAQPFDPTAALANLQPGDQFGTPSAVPTAPGALPAASRPNSYAAAPSFNSAPIGGTPKVVDLYTDWCGWCKVLEPLLERAHGKFGSKVEFTRMNAESDGKDLAQQYDVHGYPTVLLFDGSGKLIDRISGCPKSYELLEKRLVNAFPVLR